MNIYELARTNLPNTWDTLANNTYYGEPLLQSKVDFVKYRIFSTIVNSTIEESVYTPLQMHYAAKYVALQVIPVGIDYYKSQRQTITTTGTNESISYPDRINALGKLQESLTKEVLELALDLPADSVVSRKRMATPKFDSADWRTPDPKTFPKKDECFNSLPSVQTVRE